jgi:hypothetical protein
MAGMDMDAVQVAAANIAAMGWPVGPRESPCVCGQPWHTHQQTLPPDCTGYVHDPADALAQQAGAALSASLVEDIGDYDTHLHMLRRRARPPGPRVSDAGDCRRKVWYRETPPDGYVPGRVDKRAAVMGSALHARAAAARAWRYPWRKHEMAVSVPGLHGEFYIDEYDPVSGYVFDTKSCGEPMWNIVGESGPPDSQWEQVLIYAYALDMGGWPVNWVQIISVRRDNGDEEHFTRRYDPAEALKALDKLTGLASMLEAGIAPPRDGRGPSDWRCRFCPAMAHCWQVDAAKAARRSPVSWISLGEHPADPSVEWAAATAWELNKAASAAKAAADQAKDLLTGIPNGTYGDWVVTNRRRRMPDYKGTHSRNLAWWVLDEEHRPDYETVAEPERRIDRYVSVERVREADRQKRQAEQAAPDGDPLNTIA